MVIAERKVKKRSITCVVGGREKGGVRRPCRSGSGLKGSSFIRRRGEWAGGRDSMRGYGGWVPSTHKLWIASERSNGRLRHEEGMRWKDYPEFPPRRKG